MLKEALASAKPKYHMPNPNVITDVLIPGIAASSRIDCMSAYFNAQALRELAGGLATFIHSSSGKLRLLVSPELSPEELGLGADSEELSFKAIGKVLESDGSSEIETVILNHTKECLAWLRKTGRLEVKVVLKKEGLFHPKQWHFIHGEEIAVLSGSANVTLAGLTTGVETYTLYRTWTNDESKEVWKEDSLFWDQYWLNTRDDAISVPAEDAFLYGYLKKYEKSYAPSENAFEKAMERYRGTPEDDDVEGTTPELVTEILRPPKGFVWDSGPYVHQGLAVERWEAKGRIGVLEMATGSGKTLTSLLAASRLVAEVPMLVVIAVPTKVLLKQWIDDCLYFNVTPYVADERMNQESHLLNIKTLAKSVRRAQVKQKVVIVTHDFIKNAGLTEFLSKPQIASQTLLIADEVHKLSVDTFLSIAPTAKYRLGLSATPWRQFEQDANNKLKKYFGDVVFSFPLEKAIGVCLVPYNYNARLVEASDLEVDYWLEQRAAYAAWLGACEKPLSAANRKMSAMKGKQMRRWIEASQSKLEALEQDLLAIGIENVRNTLIYCTSAEPSQLVAVNSLLTKLGIPWSQLTENETKDPKKVKSILKSFKAGNVAVLTAKKVLDEGFNAPAIDTAFFLASSTSQREWIQRRGRVLRLAEGKSISHIYDYGVVAPQLDGEKESAYVRGDLLRIQEFYRLAKFGERDLENWLAQDLARYPNLTWPPSEYEPEDDDGVDEDDIENVESAVNG